MYTDYQDNHFFPNNQYLGQGALYRLTIEQKSAKVVIYLAQQFLHKYPMQRMQSICLNRARTCFAHVGPRLAAWTERSVDKSLHLKLVPTAIHSFKAAGPTLTCTCSPLRIRYSINRFLFKGPGPSRDYVLVCPPP